MTSKVMVFGSGKIGEMLAAMLSETGDYEVTVSDNNKDAFKRLDGLDVETQVVDVANQNELDKIASGFDFMLSALPFQLTKNIALAAKKGKAHYIDLTEDVATSDFVREVANDADTAFIPQSGLAPGFISIAANSLAQKYDRIDDLRLRVGALPKYPSNTLKYNLTWSTAGLVNEYIHPCNALVDGEMIKIPALDAYEQFAIDGVHYEAFNTSGGLGTLCESLHGKAKNVNYKSVRYPGHLDIMKVLLNELKLREKPELLCQIMEDAIPATAQDTVVVWVGCKGYQDDYLMQETYVTKVYSKELHGKKRSAIQITTAGSACAVVDLIRTEKLPQRGFVKQEQINLDDFLDNRFGHYYKEGEVA